MHLITQNSETIAKWTFLVGWEALLNRRGTTWRALKDSYKHNINDDNFMTLVSAYPALIKRPVFELEEMVLVGFKVDVRKTLKGSKDD